MLSETDRETLLKLAAASIAHGLQNGQTPPVSLNDYPESLRVTRACFVTLTINKQLRGCIGSLEAVRPLVKDVIENAFSAAFRDPRFNPLQADEYDSLHYHISILGPAEPLIFDSEADLIRQLQPGVDGLILEDQGRRGTFLPSVWESLPDPQNFFTQLKIKAGFSPSHWSPSLSVERYRVEDIE